MGFCGFFRFFKNLKNLGFLKRKDGKCKYEKMKLAQASTDGATIDGSRCETDITKHPNKQHVNLRNNFKVGPRDSGWALTWLTDNSTITEVTVL